MPQLIMLLKVIGMRNMIAISALLMIGGAQGAVVSCKISPTDFGPSSISWDDSTKVAKIYSSAYGTLSGRVKNTAFDRGSGKVVNLSFTLLPPEWKQSEWEFVIQRATSGFVVEGVAYVTVKGVRYLDVVLLSKDADCDLK